MIGWIWREGLGWMGPFLCLKVTYIPKLSPLQNLKPSEKFVLVDGGWWWCVNLFQCSNLSQAEQLKKGWLFLVKKDIFHIMI